MNLVALLDELAKLGAVSPEHAERAYDRLQTLETNKPTAGQALRYGALGAVAGPTAGAASDVLSGKKMFAPHEHGGKTIRLGRLRSNAGRAAAGAITTGAAPLLRYHMDRAAEMRTLRQFMEEHKEKKAADVEIKKGKEKDADFDYMPYGPGDFHQSEYGPTTGYGALMLASLLARGEDQPLDTTIRRKQAASLMPAGGASPKAKLTSAQGVALPKTTAPAGPSIAEVSKPRGFGLPAPGALKGSI